MVTRHAMRSMLQRDFDVLGRTILIVFTVGFVLFAFASAWMDIARIVR